jgi:UrcA family protein
MTTFNTFSLAMKSTMTALGSRTRFAALAALSIGMLGSAASNADQFAGESRTAHVTLAGLNLSTAMGQQVAQARLHEVARTLCNRVADSLDLSHQANYVKCVDSAVAKANQQLQALVNQQSAARVARADVK